MKNARFNGKNVVKIGRLVQNIQGIINKNHLCCGLTISLCVCFSFSNESLLNLNYIEISLCLYRLSAPYS